MAGLDAIRNKAGHVVMRRPNLADLPPVRLADGYVLRRFWPADLPSWCALLAAAFPERPDAATLPQREFTSSPLWRPERLHLVVRRNQVVACCAAWQDADVWGPRSGLIHWVAAHPAHARRGLARAAVTSALHWMRLRGYADAVLVTQTHRLAAIRLYLGLGFEPHLAAFPEMADRWAETARHLGGAAPPGR